MIKLANGRRVLRADLKSDRGVVLAVARANEWVTWTVGLDGSTDTWHAFHGHYFNTLTEAVADYDDRRGMPALEATS